MPPVRMRRSIATVLALFALVTQVAIGTATSLGMVLCIGESHAAIELGSDDCCATHLRTEHEIPTAIERTCCSDVPLQIEASLGDAQRASSVVNAVASVSTATGSLVGSVSRGPGLDAPVPLSVAGFARRSVALRV